MQITENELSAALWEADLVEDEALMREYGGRGMYGKTCPGIVTDMEGYSKFLVQLAQVNPDVAWEMAQATEWDSMGRTENIYYWRRLEIVDE